MRILERAYAWHKDIHLSGKRLINGAGKILALAVLIVSLMIYFGDWALAQKSPPWVIFMTAQLVGLCAVWAGARVFHAPRLTAWVLVLGLGATEAAANAVRFLSDLSDTLPAFPFFSALCLPFLFWVLAAVTFYRGSEREGSPRPRVLPAVAYGAGAAVLLALLLLIAKGTGGTWGITEAGRFAGWANPGLGWLAVYTVEGLCLLFVALPLRHVTRRLPLAESAVLTVGGVVLAGLLVFQGWSYFSASTVLRTHIDPPRPYRELYASLVLGAVSAVLAAAAFAVSRLTARRRQAAQRGAVCLRSDRTEH